MARTEAAQPKAMQKSRTGATDKMQERIAGKRSRAATTPDTASSPHDESSKVPGGAESLPQAECDDSSSSQAEPASASAGHVSEHGTGRTGRPRNAKKRDKVVLYLDPENVIAMKMAAVKNNARYSDVVDALIRYHLPEVTESEIEAIKESTRPAKV